MGTGWIVPERQAVSTTVQMYFEPYCSDMLCSLAGDITDCIYVQVGTSRNVCITAYKMCICTERKKA